MIRNWHSNLDSVQSSELFLLNNHLQIKPYLKQFDEAPMLISFLWKNCLWVTLTFFNVICHNTLDLDLFQVITFLSILVTQKVYFLAPIMRRISVVTTICWCQGTLIYLSSFFLCFCYITIIIIVVCFTCNTLSGMSSLVPTHTHTLSSGSRVAKLVFGLLFLLLAFRKSNAQNQFYDMYPPRIWKFFWLVIGWCQR